MSVFLELQIKLLEKERVELREEVIKLKLDKQALTKQLTLTDVVGRSEQFYCVGHKNNPCKDVNNQCKHCKVIEKFWKQ